MSFHTIRFNCREGKARVVIDNKFQAITPFSYKLTEGWHFIKAQLKGYKDYMVNYYVDKDYDYYIDMKEKETEEEPSPTPQPSPTPPREKPTEPEPGFYTVNFHCDAGNAKVFIRIILITF